MHTGQDTKKISEAALHTMEQLFLALKNDAKFTVSISEPDEYVLIYETVQHHCEHLKLHEIRQEHVDPYKLVAWLGCNLLKMIEENRERQDPPIQFKEASRVIVNLMSGFLKADRGVTLPKKTRKIIVKSLYQEQFENSEHGIWMNGLYLSFHVAVKACELQAENR